MQDIIIKWAKLGYTISFKQDGVHLGIIISVSKGKTGMSGRLEYAQLHRNDALEYVIDQLAERVNQAIKPSTLILPNEVPRPTG